MRDYMRKLLAVIGEPGTGKTTLFRKFMEDYSWETKEGKVSLSGKWNKEKKDSFNKKVKQTNIKLRLY